jgi:hypothetical protein
VGTTETAKALVISDFIAERNWFKRFMRLEGPPVARRRTFVCRNTPAVSRRHQTASDMLLNGGRKISMILMHVGSTENKARYSVMPQNCAVEVKAA